MNQIIIIFNNKRDSIKEQKMKIHKTIDFNKINQIINKEMIIDIKIEDTIRINSKIIQDNWNVNIKSLHKFKLLKLVNSYNLFILNNLKS